MKDERCEPNFSRIQSVHFIGHSNQFRRRLICKNYMSYSEHIFLCSKMAADLFDREKGGIHFFSLCHILMIMASHWSRAEHQLSCRCKWYGCGCAHANSVNTKVKSTGSWGHPANLELIFLQTCLLEYIFSTGFLISRTHHHLRLEWNVLYGISAI